MRDLVGRYRKHRALLLLFLPGFLLFLLFRYVPLYGLLVAFKDYRMLDGILASPWAGFGHFQRLLTGAGFLSALRNTLVLATLKLLFVFPSPIVLAILLNEVRGKLLKRTIQTMSYLPHFFSWVILGGILFTFFSYNGPFSGLLVSLGLQPYNPLIEPRAFYTLVIITDVWARVGWSSIVYFAALSSVDPTLYEAAIMDGAAKLQQVMRITLPSILPTIVIMLLLYLGDFLRVGFDQLYNLTTPPTSAVADVLDTYVLRRLLSLDFELGTAAGLLSSVVGLLLVLLADRLVKLYDPEQGIW